MASKFAVVSFLCALEYLMLFQGTLPCLEVKISTNPSYPETSLLGGGGFLAGKVGQTGKKIGHFEAETAKEYSQKPKCL